MEGRTDTTSYRDAETHLKTRKEHLSRQKMWLNVMNNVKNKKKTKENKKNQKLRKCKKMS